jgi:hypothetical protein
VSAARAKDVWQQQIGPSLMERPFDLEHDPVLRCALVRFSDSHARLVIEMHHIAVDGWSVGTLVHELNSLMRTMTSGQPSELPAAERQYRHYAAAERTRVDSEAVDRQRAYWRTTLAETPPLDLSALQRDHAPDGPSPSPDGELFFDLPPDVATRIVAECRRWQLTPFTFFVSAFAALLHTRTGATDIAIGTDVANRDTGEYASVVGPFTNQVLLRVAVRPDMDFTCLCRAVRDRVQEALLNKDVPYEVVARDLRDAAGNGDPLFRAKFVFHHRLPAVQLDGVTATLVDVKSTAAKYDLLLNVEEAPDGFRGSCEYRGRALQDASVADLVRGFLELCDQVTREPDIAIDRLAR